MFNRHYKFQMRWHSYTRVISNACLYLIDITWEHFKDNLLVLKPYSSCFLQWSLLHHWMNEFPLYTFTKYSFKKICFLVGYNLMMYHFAASSKLWRTIHRDPEFQLPKHARKTEWISNLLSIWVKQWHYHQIIHWIATCHSSCVYSLPLLSHSHPSPFPYDWPNDQQTLIRAAFYPVYVSNSNFHFFHPPPTTAWSVSTLKCIAA